MYILTSVLKDSRNLSNRLSKLTVWVTLFFEYVTDMQHKGLNNLAYLKLVELNEVINASFLNVMKH